MLWNVCGILEEKREERRGGREEEQTETLSSLSRHVLYCRFTQAAWNCSKLVSQRINLSHPFCSFNWFNMIFFFFHFDCEYKFILEHLIYPSCLSGSRVASCTLFSQGWHSSLAWIIISVFCFFIVLDPGVEYLMTHCMLTASLLL